MDRFHLRGAGPSPLPLDGPVPSYQGKGNGKAKFKGRTLITWPLLSRIHELNAVTLILERARHGEIAPAALLTLILVRRTAGTRGWGRCRRSAAADDDRAIGTRRLDSLGRPGRHSPVSCRP